MVMCYKNGGKMNILSLALNNYNKRNWGHQLLRNEIARQHNVVHYGKGFSNYKNYLSIQQVMDKYCKTKPDIIFVFGPPTKGAVVYEGLEKIKNIPKVHFVVDYIQPIRKEHSKFKNNIINQNKRMKKHGYDLVLTYTNMALNTLRKSKIVDNKMTAVFPFSVDINIYINMNLEKTNDVMAVYSTNPLYYPNRIKIHEILKDLSIKSETGFIVKKEMIKTINRSKIIVTSNNYYRSLSMRYTETLACGGFLLADRPDDLDFVGLKDGEHLVIYKDLKDFKNKVLYYLDDKNKKEREQIAKNGMEYVRKNHSCKIRVEQIMKFIKERI